MKVIAFGHRKGVGKDTATNFLVTALRTSQHYIRITKAGFADKVKDIAFQVYGCYGLQPKAYYDTVEGYALRDIPLPVINKSPRELWIGVGNGIRSATGLDETWAGYLFNTMSKNTDLLIVTDLRFPAEADSILKVGGQIYRIDCPWKEKVTDGADEKLEHYNKWTGVLTNGIENDYTSFHEQVVGLIPKLGL